MKNPSTELRNVHAVLLAEMEHSLGDLAARWRAQPEPDVAAALIRQYHAILKCMIELGFTDALDVETELPDDLMPAEYLQLFSET